MFDKCWVNAISSIFKFSIFSILKKLYLICTLHSRSINTDINSV